MIPTRDDLVKDAQSMQTLVMRAAALDPALWKALTGNGLPKSPLVTTATSCLTWASAYYGFGWTPDFCTAVATALGLVAGWVMHRIDHPNLIEDASKPHASV